MEFLVALLVAIVFIAVAGVDKSKLKGKIGEAQVSVLIKKHLNDSDYNLIENVTIPGKDGTTQIDHIVLSPFGIFAIEVKNMKGWIFGSKNQKNWTQKFPNKSFQFQNPLHQNYRHLKTLSAVVALQEDKFIRHIHTYTNVVLGAQDISKALRKIEKARLLPSRATDIYHNESLKEKHLKIDQPGQ